MDDIKPEVRFWELAVPCYVLGASPPFADFIIDRVMMLNNGVLLVRFDYLEAWDQKIDKVRVWVLPDLDLKYWSASSLSKLASLLGTPITVDKNTEEKSTVRYARVSIKFQYRNKCQSSYIMTINMYSLFSRRKTQEGRTMAIEAENIQLVQNTTEQVVETRVQKVTERCNESMVLALTYSPTRKLCFWQIKLLITFQASLSSLSDRTLDLSHNLSICGP
ncbi:hypothetical protein Cgig2_034181 [Carnegiea gigantea]|uniref:DUF4283 domain-containing protein n=1 Tax=Carnegiea gigantea TaxID=171969 RepID=A0A9Q1JSR7_9CARY|nr:hypothetical protein Cgig2_034181 [Carnegiea gigantea]